MHNLISHNRLAFWQETAESIRENPDTDIDTYFECISECEDSMVKCKKKCRLVFD